MVQLKIVKAWLKKRKHTDGVVAWLRCEKWCPWAIIWTSLSSMYENDDNDGVIPRDVPKGHLAVYVGENQSRFVISVKLLQNPLFKALLDKAQEEYNFTAGSRLHIPSDRTLNYMCITDMRHIVNNKLVKKNNHSIWKKNVHSIQSIKFISSK